MNSELLNILVASLISSILSALIMHSWMAHVCKRASLGHLEAGKEIGVRDYKQSHEHLAGLVNARREGYEKGHHEGKRVGLEAGKLWVNSCHAAELVGARASGFLEGDQRGRGIGYDQGFESGLEAKGEADYQKAYDEGYIRGEKYGREVGHKQSVDELQRNADKMLAGMGFPEVLGLKGRTMEEMMTDVGVFTGKPKRTRKPKGTSVDPVAPSPPPPPSKPVKPAVAKRKRVGRAPEPAGVPAQPVRTRAKGKIKA